MGEGGAKMYFVMLFTLKYTLDIRDHPLSLAGTTTLEIENGISNCPPF